MEPDGQLLQIFREETNERLDQIVESLLAIEAGNADADVIDSLFRDAHSIKGNAGMVGFDEAQSIAMAMEDILERAREQGALPPGMTDPMLHATDAIRRSVAGESDVAEKALAELRRVPTARPAQRRRPETPRRAKPARAGNGAGARTAATGRRTSPDSVHSIRVGAEKVDRMLDAVGETVLHHRRLEHVVGRADPSDRSSRRSSTAARCCSAISRTR